MFIVDFSARDPLGTLAASVVMVRSKSLAAQRYYVVERPAQKFAAFHVDFARHRENTKRQVERVHREVFGYGSHVDPRTHRSACVRKSDERRRARRRLDRLPDRVGRRPLRLPKDRGTASSACCATMATGEIYVVDVDNTPDGPPNRLAESEAELALCRVAEAFTRAFLAAFKPPAW